jgi:hypothetical protein
MERRMARFIQGDRPEELAMDKVVIPRDSEAMQAEAMQAKAADAQPKSGWLRFARNDG